jgi:hypothetical protein
MKIEGHAPEVLVRSNFTYSYLVGAATFTKMAIEIDKKGDSTTETEKLQHRACVAGSIMESVAAIESEAWTMLHHGPGHYLDSDPLNPFLKPILKIIADSIEKEQVITKYDLVLQILKDKKLDLGRQPMQDLSLLIGLRNEITHFKSLWTNELDRKKLYKTLENMDPAPPSFYKAEGMNFFPNVCLNHRRSKWALDTAISFFDYYYKELGIKSPIDIFDRSAITF